MDFKFKLYESKIFAINKAVVNLENSEGWNLKPNKTNQDLEEAISSPINKTKTKRKIENTYNGTAKL